MNDSNFNLTLIDETKKLLKYTHWQREDENHLLDNDYQHSSLFFLQLSHRLSILHHYNNEENSLPSDLSYTDIINSIYKPPRRIHLRMSPNIAQIISVWISDFITKPGNLSSAVINYFSRNTTQINFFANIVFPSLFYYFSTLEFMDFAIAFLNQLLIDANIELFEPFFISFLFGSSNFYLTFKSILSDEDFLQIYDLSKSITVFLKALTTSSNGFSSQHLSIIDKYYSKSKFSFAKTLGRFFVDLIQEHSSSYIVGISFCPIINLLSNLSPMSLFFKLIYSAIHPKFSTVYLTPHFEINPNGRTTYILTGAECYLIQNIVLESPNLVGIRVFPKLHVPENLQNSYEFLFFELSFLKILRKKINKSSQGVIFSSFDHPLSLSPSFNQFLVNQEKLIKTNDKNQERIKNTNSDPVEVNKDTNKEPSINESLSSSSLVTLEDSPHNDQSSTANSSNISSTKQNESSEILLRDWNNLSRIIIEHGIQPIELLADPKSSKITHLLSSFPNLSVAISPELLQFGWETTYKDAQDSCHKFELFLERLSAIEKLHALIHLQKLRFISSLQVYLEMIQININSNLSSPIESNQPSIVFSSPCGAISRFEERFPEFDSNSHSFSTPIELMSQNTQINEMIKMGDKIFRSRRVSDLGGSTSSSSSQVSTRSSRLSSIEDKQSFSILGDLSNDINKSDLNSSIDSSSDVKFWRWLKRMDNHPNNNEEINSFNTRFHYLMDSIRLFPLKPIDECLSKHLHLIIKKFNKISSFKNGSSIYQLCKIVEDICLLSSSFFTPEINVESQYFKCCLKILKHCIYYCKDDNVFITFLWSQLLISDFYKEKLTLPVDECQSIQFFELLFTTFLKKHDPQFMEDFDQFKQKLFALDSF